MKRWLLAWPLLYWFGTNAPILQYQKAVVTSGEYKGLHGTVNYLWASGEVDLTRYYIFHYYITDYRSLQYEK